MSNAITMFVNVWDAVRASEALGYLVVTGLCELPFGDGATLVAMGVAEAAEVPVQEPEDKRKKK